MTGTPFATERKTIVGQLDGKVAFITGAARGQGRTEAVRLAREGAKIIAVDIAGPVSAFNTYDPATADDLAETVRLVESEGGQILAEKADVRDLAALKDVVGRGVEKFGRLDVVVANAGINNWNRFWEMSEEQWDELVEINLTGVWKTLAAAAPHIIEAGNGGSIIITSSVAGIKSLPAQAHYGAAKHGVVGLAKTAAIELGEYDIRVNTIHPWGVDTVMGNDQGMQQILADHPQYGASFASILPDPPIATTDDIADAVVWLASDLSRSVTATQLPLDMGATKV